MDEAESLIIRVEIPSGLVAVSEGRLRRFIFGTQKIRRTRGGGWKMSSVRILALAKLITSHIIDF